MNKIKLLHQYLPFSILLVAIFSVAGYMQTKTGLPIANTTFWWVVNICILYLFFKAKKHFFNPRDTSLMMFLDFYLLWNVFSFLRGFFIAETYWDWKSLFANGMALLIPIVAYSATNSKVLQLILQFYIKYTLPFFFLIVFLIPSGAYGFYLVPLSFLGLFTPVIKKSWKWIIITSCILIAFANFGARSNVIKFLVPIFLSLIYYLRFSLSASIFEFIRKLLIVIPIVFFALASSGIFNIFNISDYVAGNYVDTKKNSDGKIVTEDLTADTRTFLYKDVLTTAAIYNSWLIGRSPARGNISASFGKNDLSGRGERGANEVAILNVFTWTGFVGVLFYLIIFFKASFLAINQSNNVFSKILGLFVAFRWCYAWVEDINNFSLTTFFLWIMIGMCFSKTFRKMSDKDVADWINGIFEKPNYLRKKYV